MLDGKFNDVSSWLYSRIPQVFDAGRGFDIHTEEELASAWTEARSYTEDFCILDIHLDPKEISLALQRLAGVLGKRMKS
jgi:indolepyruvate decarboxylase